ncbi:unnamed protein product [Linum tenue]|uniref:DUF3511 domain protein n=1 Tax=Linum tenue TaxID=586396 RepID=A0AAV0JIK6_9ROSI|nr:unnamed protein product [Linum tenue]
MEEYYYNRSRSYTCSNYNDRPSRLPAASATNSASSYELRSYSTSSYQVARYYDDHHPREQNGHSKSQQQKEKKKKKKDADGSAMRSWSVKDPELQRKKRVASYKMYSAQGRVKGTFRNSFRWLKDSYTRVVYGWW